MEIWVLSERVDGTGAEATWVPTKLYADRQTALADAATHLENGNGRSWQIRGPFTIAACTPDDLLRQIPSPRVGRLAMSLTCASAPATDWTKPEGTAWQMEWTLTLDSVPYLYLSEVGWKTSRTPGGVKFVGRTCAEVMAQADRFVAEVGPFLLTLDAPGD